VSRGHAHFSASAAVRCVAGGIHASGATRGLAAAGGRAFAIFANLPRAARFSAPAAVLGIRVPIDANVGAIVVASVAIHRALSGVAHGGAVGGRGANRATGATIVEVAIELLATPVASLVASRTGQSADRALADGIGMRRAGAGHGTITAVARIAGQIDA